MVIIPRNGTLVAIWWIPDVIRRTAAASESIGREAQAGRRAHRRPAAFRLDVY